MFNFFVDWFNNLELCVVADNDSKNLYKVFFKYLKKFKNIRKLLLNLYLLECLDFHLILVFLEFLTHHFLLALLLSLNSLTGHQLLIFLVNLVVPKMYLMFNKKNLKKQLLIYTGIPGSPAGPASPATKIYTIYYLFLQ